MTVTEPQTMKTMRCSSCSAEMAFPASAKYVKCPSCRTVTDNQPLRQSTCIGCHSTLSHPSMAQFIRCPKCLTTMLSSGAIERENREREKKAAAEKPKQEPEEVKADTEAPSNAKKEMAYCGTCASLLSFPTGARFILCPACKKTMNPDDEQHTMCSCCRTLLSHPSRSLYIQCPVCLRTQNIREKRMQAGVVNMIPLPQPTLIPQAQQQPPPNESQTPPPANNGSLEGQKPEKVDPSAMLVDNGENGAAAGDAVSTSLPKAHEGAVPNPIQENKAEQRPLSTNPKPAHVTVKRTDEEMAS